MTGHTDIPGAPASPSSYLVNTGHIETLSRKMWWGVIEDTDVDL